MKIPCSTINYATVLYVRINTILTIFHLAVHVLYIYMISDVTCAMCYIPRQMTKGDKNKTNYIITIMVHKHTYQNLFHLYCVLHLQKVFHLLKPLKEAVAHVCTLI